VNDRVALGRESVRRAFAEADVALLVADWTSRDPVIARTIESHVRSGVPLYVVHSRDPNAEPELLPAVLTPGIVIEAVRRAGA
jgi:thiol:disulfide interchange protein DsbD